MELATVTAFLTAFWKHTLEYMRWLLAPDDLPPAEDSPDPVPPRAGRSLRWLLASETLPPLPAVEEEKRGFWRWLLARETLEELPGEEPRGRPSWLRYLLARETLLPHQAKEKE